MEHSEIRIKLIFSEPGFKYNWFKTHNRLEYSLKLKHWGNVWVVRYENKHARDLNRIKRQRINKELWNSLLLMNPLVLTND